MLCKFVVAWGPAVAVCGGLLGPASAEDPKPLVPTAIELKSEPCGDGWTRWDSIGNAKGAVTHRERITAMTAKDNDLWIGTSLGRLLTRREDRWTLQGRLDGIQITGIAVEGAGKVWLSTSDGIRRLEREGDKPWHVKEHRHYYEGHPSFVSGGYIPGVDAVRLWGYVDGIYVPRQEQAYAPFVISTEHGLFCSSRGYVWHHFMPHYWGANSPWLDTRELVPHRRPTCIVEDCDGNLWIGTEWDGLIRLNAHARKYHSREPENNKKDGTEFSFIGPEQIGCKFDRVADLTAAGDHGVWAILTSREHGTALARFDGQRWQTHPLDGPARSVAEVEPGVVLIGVDGTEWRRQFGLRKVTWTSKKIELPVGPDGVIREIVRLTKGRVFAASWWSLFESNSTAKQAPAK